MNLQESSHTPEIKIPAQLKKFQRLSQKLKQEKARLEEWQNAQNDIQNRVMLELIPAFEQLTQNKFEQVQLLAAQKNNKFTDGQSKKLREKTIRIALDLRHSPKISPEQYEILKVILMECGVPIYEDLIMDLKRNKLCDEFGEFGELEYGDCEGEEYEEDEFEYEGDEDESDEDESDDFVTEEELAEYDWSDDLDEDELLALQIANIKIKVCIEYCVDQDFFDFEFDQKDPQDLINKVREKLIAIEEQKVLNQFHSQEREQAQRDMQRQKDKQAKKMQQREQAKKIANQSMKSIYLKIAAMIHPDREQNEQKKDEKTILFQQLNQAYETKDLFTLLEFQVGLGQEQGRNLAAEHLKAYNIILEEQLENVDNEIEDIIESFDWNNFDVHSKPTYKIKDLYKKYEQDWKNVEQELERSKIITEHYKDIKMIKQLMRSGYVWEMH